MQSFIYELGVFLDLYLPDYPCEIILRCHGVNYQNWARHDPKGNLIWKRPQIVPDRTSMLIHDWFFEQENRLQWVVQIYSWCENSGITGYSNLFLMVDCELVSVVDHTSQDIEAKYGPRVKFIWDQVWGQTEFTVWDQKPLFEFFERTMKEQGWTYESLRAELKAHPGVRELPV